jgi:hypothetical protein
LHHCFVVFERERTILLILVFSSLRRHRRAPTCSPMSGSPDETSRDSTHSAFPHRCAGYSVTPTDALVVASTNARVALPSWHPSPAPCSNRLTDQPSHQHAVRLSKYNLAICSRSPQRPMTRHSNYPPCSFFHLSRMCLHVVSSCA